MTRRALSFTVTIPLPQLGHPGTVARRAVAGVWRTLLIWQERANGRAQLRAMGPHMRRDIGVSYEDSRLEARKPFWLP